jgi:hypothetical protein
MGRVWNCYLEDYNVIREDAPTVARIVRAGSKEVYVGWSDDGSTTLAVIRPASGGETDQYHSLPEAKNLLRALTKAIAIAEAQPPVHVAPRRPDVQMVDLDNPPKKWTPGEPF